MTLTLSEIDWLAQWKKEFKVTQVESVKSHTQKGRKNKPAFAVIDLGLGDGNGLEVVKEIQQSKK